MLLPWGTDAPVYHWPVATAGLILTNIAIFVGEATGTVDADSWSLALGHGLHPAQWISHAFL
ncbi:MAG TPA: rhomboid family intramembrane serine protease, partial [Isosphaeraceae bacterium]|nr:rhomboid family intramembrane serine protease [Isosphaeraceae bacterium]